MPEKRLHNRDIYAAVTDDDALAALSTSLPGIFGARSCLIMWHFGDGSADILSHSGYFTGEQLDLYARDFAGMDPWAAAAARNPENVALNLEEMVPSSAYEQSAFYNEYVRAIGDDTYRCMGVSLSNSWGRGMVAIQRGKSQSSFEPEQVGELNRVVTDLTLMLSIRGRLSAAERAVSSFNEALDRLPQPTFLVDGKGRLHFANAAAEEILRGEAGMALRNGRLEAVSQRSQMLLEEALARAATDGGSGTMIHLECTGNKRVLASVAPVVRDSFRYALLVLETVEPRAEQVAAQLRSLFGLSNAEAQIAMEISRGCSVLEIASARSVSIDTVRVQVKSLARKLGCRRQAEMVSLIRSVAHLSPRL